MQRRLPRASREWRKPPGAAKPPAPAVLVALSALAALTLLTAPAGAEIIDRVLAVAAGQIITLSDVTAARAFGLVAPARNGDPIGATLASLIDRELILVEVDRYAPPEPAAEAVAAGLAAIRARFATAAAFEAALARSGIDEGGLREAVRRGLRIRAYEDQRFPPSDPRRQSMIDDWIAGLRRRSDVVNVYLSER